MHWKMQLHELQLTLNRVSSASEYHFEYTAEYMSVDVVSRGKSRMSCIVAYSVCQYLIYQIVCHISMPQRFIVMGNNLSVERTR